MDCRGSRTAGYRLADTAPPALKVLGRVVEEAAAGVHPILVIRLDSLVAVDSSAC
ncbi:hypothetical protein [Mycolicibacterium sp. CBMA 213]|uniref:hypothetical protein n=1 Tax=Mycolicibacterium sp. CBMA 213 TaxID=1968788 RepID=UPI0012DCD560|nr:hypothetical protein [Mycolicibacterium sp. CBMA 213]